MIHFAWCQPSDSVRLRRLASERVCPIERRICTELCRRLCTVCTANTDPQVGKMAGAKLGEADTLPGA